jgi:preprotein translocase subunit YajC
MRRGRQGIPIKELGPRVKEPSMGLGSLGDNFGSLAQMLPFVLIFVVFYFFLIRPQQQKQKTLRAMLDNLRRGDRVVTGGGIIGTVAKVTNDDEVQIDIAEGVRVRVLRSTITSLLAKTEPVAAKDNEADDAETTGTAIPGLGDKRKSGPRRAAGK